MKNALITLREISQQLESDNSHARQLDIIVDSVCEAMLVDVCSLYVVTNDRLILSATRGLNPSSVHRIEMQLGEGLVGFTAMSRHPVNVDDARVHPKFELFPLAKEKRFHAFLGVPIIFQGETVGVLVVQQREVRKFSDNEEAFLVTVASQLTSLLSRNEILAGRDAGSSVQLQGVKGAPGIGIGSIRFIDAPSLDQVEFKEIENIEEELSFFLKALEKTREELKNHELTLSAAIPSDVSAMFGVYRLILEDMELIQKINNEISTGISSSSAVKHVIYHYISQFENMEDEYLKTRAEDIKILGNKLYGNLIGDKLFTEEPEGQIILAGDLITITDIAKYSPEQLAGVICSSGSKLSHTVVLAHALGVPAVMGIGELKHFTNGTLAIVDGHQGQIILNPTDALVNEYTNILVRDKQLHDSLEHLRDKPALTDDNVRIKLYTNTGLLSDLSPGLLRGAEGIGLYRTEIPFMVHENFPTEDEQYHIYRNVLEAYKNKPVHIRTLDIGGDKQLPYYAIKENNPALGWRGIRFTLDNTSIFMTQIRAMLRASEGLDNLNIILPMVSRSDEITRFKLLLDDAHSQLLEEEFQLNKPRIGIMLEVPGTISLLPLLARQLDFISIGSNDLSQYLLAVDRDNPRVSQMYDHLHPAVIHEINRIMHITAKHNIDVSLCGEMASDPLAVILLTGMGLRTLSVSAYNLPTIKYVLSKITITKAKSLLGKALKMENESEIRTLLGKYLNSLDLSYLPGTTY